MHSAVAAAVPGWTPKCFGSDLAAWLRADRVSLISGAVSSWSDLSKNARNFTQGTPANRLGFSASDAAYNNRPVVLGTGSGWLDASGAWTLTQPFTVLIVGQSGSYADWRTFFDCTAGARTCVRAEPANLLATYAGTGNVTSASVASPSIFAAIFNGASSAHYVSSTTASGTSSPGTDGIGTPRIGAGPGGIYLLQATSKIAEIIVVKRALTLADIKRWQRYARGRYGIAVSGL